jgi:prepilin-type N-terminal cleavage/methylation domain-containing protein
MATSALFLAAGLAKVADLPSFQRSLEGWTILPPQAANLLVITLPLAEVTVGLAGLLGLFRASIRVAGIVLTAGILAASVAQHVAGAPPACSCFGRLTQAMPGSTFPLMVGILLFMLAGYWVQNLRQSEGPDRRPPVVPRGGTPATRGFTLVETILVVSLLGVLLSLMIPALSRTRDRAREVVVLNDLRMHANIFTHYTVDSKDYFPYGVYPEGSSILRCRSRDVAREVLYFQFSTLWQIFLADTYYNGDLFSRSFMSPFQSQVNPDEWEFGWTSYFYPCVFFTRPEYWDPLTRLEPTSQFGATRASEVVYPAMKSLMVEYLFDRPEPAPGGIKRRFVSFVDGHARAADQSDDLVMRGGDGTIDVTVRYLGHAPGHFWPFQHTLYGVRGRDTR